jgi:hypothetical protein
MLPGCTNQQRRFKAAYTSGICSVQQPQQRSFAESSVAELLILICRLRSAPRLDAQIPSTVSRPMDGARAGVRIAYDLDQNAPDPACMVGTL